MQGAKAWTSFGAVFAVVVSLPRAAAAAEDDASLSLPPLVLRSAGFAAAARPGSGGYGGVLLGADGGVSWLLPAGPDKSQQAGSFGVRFGYDFGNGLSFDGRYDDLGVVEAKGPLQAVTLGGRYALPLLVMPFVDVRAGAQFDAVAAQVVAAPGAGVAVPVSRHLALDLTARDWLAVPGERLRSIITLRLGATVTFGGR
ncbi:MAG TPA: hypothetical protein VHB21_01170 [Minicystis sp.]|nr:hypothetical protein [Minicystis sp.]